MPLIMSGLAVFSKMFFLETVLMSAKDEHYDAPCMLKIDPESFLY